VKRWLRRLAAYAGIFAVGLVLLVLTASTVVRQVAVHRAERDFPPPGLLVEFDDRRSHIHCVGSGSPTILLESGLDDRGSWGWDHMLDELSRISRVCAYDRAGIIWSEPRRGPRDAVRIADELHAILAATSEPPPYVLVGHSLGGLLVRVFDQQHPGEVAGFVFVDPSHPEQNQRFPLEFRRLIEHHRFEFARRWLMGVAAPFRIFAPESPTARTAYWWRSIPDGVMRESGQFDAMSRQASRSVSLGNRPVVVLSAGVPLAMPGISQVGNDSIQHVWLQLHGELAELSTNSDHRIVQGARHYIHWEQPEVVIAAIRDVIDAARQGEQVRRAATEVVREERLLEPLSEPSR
jgi:pimeloyl-ACP methyl ester carboxylesterase